MKIFFNGDSHTCGSELKDPLINCYSYRLAQLLNAEVIGNPSVGGAGNDRILRTTEEFLHECKGNYPDLIVIGWSECYRFDWYYETQYRTCGSENDGLSLNAAEITDVKRYKYTIENMRNSELGILAVYFQNQMFNLHLKLNHLKIPNLFLNAHCSFNEHMIGYQNFKFYEFDWNKSFWNPYDNTNGCFLTWGKNKGYRPTTHHHLPKEAHEEFSYLLKNYIKTNIL